MEAALAWGPTPVDELFLNADGTPSAGGIALEGLRRLEQEATTRPADQLLLDLPPAAFQAVQTALPALRPALSARYGARLDVRPGTRDRIEVHAP